jgi:hypothetical protein
MTYVLSFVVVAIGVVLAIFTGVWGGLVWIVVAGIALAVLMRRAASLELARGKTGPSGRPRTPATGSGTANERVGQG